MPRRVPEAAAIFAAELLLGKALKGRREQAVIMIPGTKRLKGLEENALAVGLSLSADERGQLNALVTQTSGERYGERGLSMVER